MAGARGGVGGPAWAKATDGVGGATLPDTTDGLAWIAGTGARGVTALSAKTEVRDSGTLSADNCAIGRGGLAAVMAINRSRST